MCLLLLTDWMFADWIGWLVGRVGVIGGLKMGWVAMVAAVELVVEVVGMGFGIEAEMGAFSKGELERDCLLVCWFWHQTERV